MFSAWPFQPSTGSPTQPFLSYLGTTKQSPTRSCLTRHSSCAFILATSFCLSTRSRHQPSPNAKTSSPAPASMSAVRATALRAGGACVRCRKGKTKCVYENGRAPCKNCAKGMHECYLPSESMSHGGHGVSPARTAQRVRESLPTEKPTGSGAHSDRHAQSHHTTSVTSRTSAPANEKYVLIFFFFLLSYILDYRYCLFSIVTDHEHLLLLLLPPLQSLSFCLPAMNQLHIYTHAYAIHIHTTFTHCARRLAYAASVSPLRCVSVYLHAHHSLIFPLHTPKHPTVGLHRAEDMTRAVEAKEMLLTRFGTLDPRSSLVGSRPDPLHLTRLLQLVGPALHVQIAQPTTSLKLLPNAPTQYAPASKPTSRTECFCFRAHPPWPTFLVFISLFPCRPRRRARPIPVLPTMLHRESQQLR